MVKIPFACGECHLVLDDGVDSCPRCPTARVSSEHQGYVIIMNPTRSEIAKRLKIDRPGKYALKVSIR
ncbi:DNA-directed RNA polymerase subunit E'' [Euryarchaeota archaeon]|nr:DNA-directed RNA polymerase subunit E'' [Candidatus Poseidoniaceae archaeon]MDA8546790.1 DNA-directed RNA polymerase subunit E'' [Euryarchaeota archaeon]MDA8568207.1 DNA-directed RNA polymerase subunit E'' [Euryarchaeota archaeon]MDA8610368.1 DNA-directed RNA polymerase subunit E'' [Euryarchaeota archaeon]MDA8689784.1 DNA-directed RNA polymerase subunit E'' [Euryarchaeota archaeon]